MATFQNFSLKDQESEFSDVFKDSKSLIKPIDLNNFKNRERKEYLPSIISSIFGMELSRELIPNLTRLFLLYLECENKHFYKDKITNNLKLILRESFHNDINKYLLSLRKIQHIIKNVDFENYKVKNDLCRLERFFLNTILRKYTDNLVRGHRR